MEEKSARAHINNTGRLHEFLSRGRSAFCLKSPENRKTDFRLFAVEEGGLGALIDTQIQMKAFEKAFERGLIPWLGNCQFLQRNAKLGNSLIDYLFDCGKSHLYLEVKSAVLREGDYAMYPDCPSLRGQRHVNDLIHWARSGQKAILVFMAALPGVRAFKPNRCADQRLYDLLSEAQKVGVQFKALGLYYHPIDTQIYMFAPDMEVALGL